MRKTLRLPSFDYSTPGAYFVTLATQDRRPAFGTLNDAAAIALNDIGRMVERWWSELPRKFPSVLLDTHALMPDHLHGLILLGTESPRDDSDVSLSQVIQWLKTMTTSEYFRRVRSDGWPALNKRLWQRGFHDHVVRDETDLEQIREYIEGNPGALWERLGRRTRQSDATSTLKGRRK